MSIRLSGLHRHRNVALYKWINAVLGGFRVNNHYRLESILRMKSSTGMCHSIPQHTKRRKERQDKIKSDWIPCKRVKEIKKRRDFW